VALIVQKYGGTSVASVERIQAVAQRVLKSRAKGDRIVVVVSAMAGETNRLFKLASELSPAPEPRETDVLVATGEQVSAALLAIHLQALGAPALSFLAHQLRIDDPKFTPGLNELVEAVQASGAKIAIQINIQGAGVDPEL
jgi:aspartate kinase